MTAGSSPWSLSTAGCSPRAISRSSASDADSSSLARASAACAPLGVLVDQPVGDPEPDRERDEPLLRAVVEVALEPPPLGVAGGDDARPRRRELLARLGVRERLGDQLGEGRDAVLGAGGEGVRAHARDHHRAPQLTVEDDRRADARVDAERLQPLGQQAGQAPVVVDALGRPLRQIFGVSVSPSSSMRAPIGTLGTPGSFHWPITSAVPSWR